MKGLDTNVLVRYLTQDDPAQGATAIAAIEQPADGDADFYLSDVALCELVWVLESAYGYGTGEIAAILDRILRTQQFQFAAKEVLWQALADYRAMGGDFADHLIGRKARRAGCAETLTFDKALRASPHFRVL
jgi:predicted nucleic-acid-binding protein